jgi:hypothetical protein
MKYSVKCDSEHSPQEARFNTKMKIRVKKLENFLRSWATISFSRRTLRHLFENIQGNY